MFLYGELSVVISAMAVWMDLKDASVDNGWILFSFMIGFLIQITEIPMQITIQQWKHAEQEQTMQSICITQCLRLRIVHQVS